MSTGDEAAAILAAVQGIATWHTTIAPIMIRIHEHARWAASSNMPERGAELIQVNIEPLRELAEQLPRLIDLVDDALADG